MKASTLIPVLISLAALGVSIWSLVMTIRSWRRSFRPMVSVAVKTHEANAALITYDLVVINSGKIPAMDIRLIAKSKGALEAALGKDASAANKQRWLACFHQVIPLLLNGDKTTASFGDTQANHAGFWIYKSKFSITISYTDWFARPYNEEQRTFTFLTSDTFTGYSWG